MPGGEIPKSNMMDISKNGKFSVIENRLISFVHL
jgi:hypothetical protein